LGNINVGWLKKNITFIKAGAEHGYSTTKIWRDIFKERPGIRKTDYLATMRYFFGNEERARDAWKSTPRKYKPAENTLGHAPFDIRKEYMVEYTAKTIDSVTGEHVTFTGRLGMDTLRTREEIEDLFRENAESDYITSIWEVAANPLIYERVENVKIYRRL